MKKITVLALAMALAFALAGCGASSAPSSSAASEEVSSSSEAVEPSSSASASSASASSQSVEAIPWKDAKTADEAAKGAGFDKFGVMDRIIVNDAEYADPTFAYAGGVAQATYEKGAVEVIVRKANGKHDVPLSDRDLTEFAQKWAKSYEGLDVTLYGPAKGAATVITWSDGTQDFGITCQGLGGEEVTMDSDDVASIVKGFKEANAKEQPKQEEPKQEQPKQEAQPAQAEQNDEADEDDAPANNMTISQGDAEAAAEGMSGGWTTGSYQDYVDGHGWVWVVMTNDENGNHNTYYVDDYGNPYNADFDSNSSTELTLSEADACGVAADVSGGWATGAYPESTENHGMCWHVTTEDENGNVVEYYVDNSGNAFNIEFE